MGKICLVAMNAVSEDLEFTIETVYDLQNRRLATLDFECEVIDNQISYSYFQKPMKTPLVIGAASAMSEHQKFSILTNEVIRRMSNMSENRTQDERTGIIHKRIENTGYSRSKAR